MGSAHVQKKRTIRVSHSLKGVWPSSQVTRTTRTTWTFCLSCRSFPPRRDQRPKGLCEETLARFRKKQVNQNAVIGGRVCRINEAEEPSDIIWENIDTTFFQR